MYEDMGKSMGDDVIGGGEFLAAIDAAKALEEEGGGGGGGGSPAKIVLADRDSLSTIRRAAELALRTGDPFGVLSALNDANRSEMDGMERKVRARLGEGAEEAEVTAELIEAIKSDAKFRAGLFERLEAEVPVFTRAFLEERDYIMSEAVRREEGSRRAVAVVGLAHVPGIERNLRAAFGIEVEGVEAGRTLQSLSAMAQD
mmetsp:Transcript_10957/g.22938  ORF Transcript_10957/g.22938 Transcript_10957/m.22938 type:complete len:201 (-) Transcript_10957:68-670(-)